MYKLNTTISGESIIRTNTDGTKTSIPTNMDNSDYQEYLKWLAEGNTPEPADE